MENIILNSILLIIGMSIISGLIGPLIVWKHMACFTDTISHASLMAFVLSAFVGLPSVLLIFLISALFSAAIFNNKTHSTNTMLTVINSSTFAASMMLISLNPTLGLNIASLLFGDILLVGTADIVLMYLLAALILGITCFRWKKWLLVVISEDVSTVEGINVNWIKIEFMLMLSFFIAIIMHIIGTLLISALIIVPAATARMFSNNPKGMVVLATVICMTTSFIGLFISFKLDLITSATIVSVSVATFALCYPLSFCLKKGILLKIW